MNITYVDFQDGNKLSFHGFPDLSAISYYKRHIFDSHSLSVTDHKTQQVSQVYFSISDLQDAGFSAIMLQRISISRVLAQTDWLCRLWKRAQQIVPSYLGEDSEYTRFFKDNLSFAVRRITAASYLGVSHLKSSKREPGEPGLYIDHAESSVHIFINLKKTKPLGTGNFGKTRRVLWLNPPNDCPQVVAKKVMLERTQQTYGAFLAEIEKQKTFSNRIGIVPIICGRAYTDGKNKKHAFFMPCYSGDLINVEPIARLSMNEKLSLIAQWLEGLVAISEKGVHRDIKPDNLLVDGKEENIKGGICDFGLYTPHGSPGKFRSGTPQWAPPEWHSKETTSKHDVWGMGASFFDLFKDFPSYFLEENELKAWARSLPENWARAHFQDTDAPEFIVELINSMLDPREAFRITPQEALGRFREGHDLYKNSKAS